jgi:hypothetical protein
MSAGNDDKLRIPIEIQTEDLKELQEVIQNISEAESDLRSIKPRKGAGTGDFASRNAIGSQQSVGFGAFATVTENKPTAIRDKTSRAAFQREREFDKVRDRIEQIEENQSNTAGILSQFGNILGFSGIGANLNQGAKGAAASKGAMPRAASAVGAGAGALTGAKTLAAGGAGGVFGRLMGVAGKAFLPAAVAIMVFEMIQSIISEMFKPGGLFDRRFKRIIQNEIAQSADLEEKQRIAQGLQVVRVATQPGIRGQTGQVTSNLNRVINNDVGIYGMDLHMKGKGLT